MAVPAHPVLSSINKHEARGQRAGAGPAVVRAVRVSGDAIDERLLTPKQRRELLAELRQSLVDKDRNA